MVIQKKFKSKGMNRKAQNNHHEIENIERCDNTENTASAKS